MFLLIIAILFQPTTRELSVSHIKKEDREKYLQTVSFILNSLSKERRIIVPKLENDKIKFDLEDYGIESTIFDNMLNIYKTSRADLFIERATKAPNYYKLLGTNDIKSFYKLVKYSDQAQEERAIMLTSQFARFGRGISRIPLLTGGYLWKTYDSKSDMDMFSDKHVDSISYIGSLPNGLLAYFATDNKKNPLNIINPEMAIDPLSNDKIVKVGSSCIICHNSGITEFKDSVKELTEKEIRLTSPDKKIIEKFTGRIDKHFPRDQEDYAEAVKKTNNLTPKQNAKQLKELIDTYNNPLTKEDCAKELDIAVKELENRIKKMPFLSIEFAQLLKDNTIRRDRWEEIHKLLE